MTKALNRSGTGSGIILNRIRNYFQNLDPDPASLKNSGLDRIWTHNIESKDAKCLQNFSFL
jgi:hypothetical protein